MIATSYNERMALIASLAPKYNARTKMKKAAKASSKRAAAKAQTTVQRDFMQIPKESNIYAYTDASRYAKEYYGETLHYTTKFDNDWD